MPPCRLHGLGLWQRPSHAARGFHLRKQDAVGLILMVLAFAAAAVFGMWRDARGAEAALDEANAAYVEQQEKGWELVDEVVRLEGLIDAAGSALAEAVETETELRASLDFSRNEVRGLEDRLRAEAVAKEALRQELQSARSLLDSPPSPSPTPTPIPIPTPTPRPRDTVETGLLCTGSMAPAITCLDRITWLTDFAPSEIAIGTVIAFNPNCEGENRLTAHRVIDIRVENGTRYFWPKGDAAAEPDGCWVPQAWVSGYVVEVKRGVVPENQHLYQSVQGALAAFEDKLTFWDSLNPEAKRAGFEGVQRAERYYLCWLQNARDSEYPGHIPYECG